MPINPSSPIFLIMSVGNSPSSMRSINGMISSFAKSRTILRIINCSSVKCRSITAPPKILVVFVETASRFLTEPAGFDILAQERAWAVFAIAESVVQHFHDIKARIESDKVSQLERSHRVVHAELHYFVDRFFRRDPFL